MTEFYFLTFVRYNVVFGSGLMGVGEDARQHRGQQRDNHHRCARGFRVSRWALETNINIIKITVRQYRFSGGYRYYRCCLGLSICRLGFYQRGASCLRTIIQIPSLLKIRERYFTSCRTKAGKYFSVARTRANQKTHRLYTTIKITWNTKKKSTQ